MNASMQQVWRGDMKLPDRKVIVAGVVGQATNVVEHPSPPTGSSGSPTASVGGGLGESRREPILAP